MEIAFRWYGDKDRIPLKYIRQIPKVTGIVSALYDVAVGEIWPKDKIINVKRKIEAEGFKFSVIESIPVHEDIKLGNPNRDILIDNYCQSIRNMGALGIQILCYNFMPVFDWVRTDLAKKYPNGSNSLSYDNSKLKEIDFKTISLDLPGWATNYTKEELQYYLNAYSKVDNEILWLNLEYFLRKVIPVAEEYGVKMAIHPDDPPWSIFGLPRIITDEVALDRLVRIIDSPSNGITFCTGSFGANLKMDLVKVIRKFGMLDRIPFIHFRNVKHIAEKQFYESKHPTEFGDVNMYEVVKTLIDIGFDGVIRPDHGRMIWGETGRPGYGLYDRALGVMYLVGLWEGISKTFQSN
ncbi:MAG: mannonate dehydratase [Candidatus Lokiarchaeota archaeon]|nr:mannonate dehydratase [Candidatus Lokiarchaeota archaeon]